MRSARLLSLLVCLNALAAGLIGSVAGEEARPPVVPGTHADTDPARPAIPPVDRARDEAAPAADLLLQASALAARGEDLLDRADRRSVDRAKDLFELALKADAANGAAHAGLARVAAIRLGRRWVEDDALIDEALARAAESLERTPGDPRAHAAASIARMAAEEWSEAAEAAARAWSLRGPGTPPWIAETYAQTLIAAGDPNAALAILDDILTARPERFQAHLVRGAALMHAGRSADAVLAFRRALLLEDGFPPAQIQLATAYDRLDLRPIAASIFERTAVAYPEERARIHLRMAGSLISRGLHDQALPGLEEVRLATKLGFGEGTRLFMIATCLERTGRADAARPLYETVVREYPLASYGSPSGGSLAVEALVALARLDIEAGDAEGAVRRLEQATALPRPTVALYLTLARLYAGYGLHAQAVETLRAGAGARFPARDAGSKASIYAAWSRAARTAGLPVEPVLAALDRDTESIAAGATPSDLIEAARACALAGDVGRAVIWIRRAVERGYAHLDWIAGDADLSAVARDPGFAALARAASRDR